MDALELTQENLEHTYSKKAARGYVLDIVLSEPDFLNVIGEGIELIEEWAKAPSQYDKKKLRKEAVLTMDLKDLVQKIVVDTLLIRSTSTLATFASSLGVTLGFEDNHDGITLAGELLAVLLPTGLYTIAPKVRNGQWHVIPNFLLTVEERLIAERGMFIPPSIEKPKRLKSNRDSGYKYLKGESLILGGSFKHHDGDITLDNLNRQNSIKLSLCFDFIDSNDPDLDIHIKDLVKKWKAEGKTAYNIQQDIQQEITNWNMHLLQTDHLHDLMDQAGNVFYVCNKTDNRGRTYAQGHHINPMGTSYKKASIELTKQEKVEIPEDFFK